MPAKGLDLMCAPQLSVKFAKGVFGDHRLGRRQMDLLY